MRQNVWSGHNMRASIVVKNTCHTVEVLRKMATDSHREIQRVLRSRGAGTPSSSESIVDSQEEYIYGARGLSHFSMIIKNGPTDLPPAPTPQAHKVVGCRVGSRNVEGHFIFFSGKLINITFG